MHTLRDDRGWVGWCVCALVGADAYGYAYSPLVLTGPELKCDIDIKSRKGYHAKSIHANPSCASGINFTCNCIPESRVLQVIPFGHLRTEDSRAGKSCLRSLEPAAAARDVHVCMRSRSSHGAYALEHKRRGEVEGRASINTRRTRCGDGAATKAATKAGAEAARDLQQHDSS